MATAPVPPPIPMPLATLERVTVPEPKPSPSQPTLPGPEAVVLTIQGDNHMAKAEVRIARAFYERAAMAGDAEAALRLGATYDPVFIKQARLPVAADQALADYWYAWAGLPAKR